MRGNYCCNGNPNGNTKCKENIIYNSNISRRITITDRIIPTVGKHIVGKQSRTRGSVAVAIDKPGNHRVIITALQVVEARFGIVVIPTVPQGLSSARLPLEEMILPQASYS